MFQLLAVTNEFYILRSALEKLNKFFLVFKIIILLTSIFQMFRERIRMHNYIVNINNHKT